jgi:hypothetical protein
VELLHGGVRGAELEKREQSSPKHALKGTKEKVVETVILQEPTHVWLRGEKIFASL